MYIAVDFDNTICFEKYPGIGDPIPFALETLRDYVKDGHKLILYTLRSGKPLLDAVSFLKENGVELYAVNNNLSQNHWTASRKVFAHVYIDDRNYGTPLTYHTGFSKPVVDWSKIHLERWE